MSDVNKEKRGCPRILLFAQMERGTKAVLHQIAMFIAFIK